MTDKLTHIHDRVYCCRSGSAADTQVRLIRKSPPPTSLPPYLNPLRPSPTSFITTPNFMQRNMTPARPCTRSRPSSSRSVMKTRIVSLRESLWPGGTTSRADRCIIFRSEAGSLGSRGRLAVSFARTATDVVQRAEMMASLGSGSTYVYGYCDATYKEGMTEEETVNFVKNSKSASSRLCSNACPESLCRVLFSSFTRHGPRRLFRRLHPNVRDQKGRRSTDLCTRERTAKVSPFHIPLISHGLIGFLTGSGKAPS